MSGHQITGSTRQIPEGRDTQEVDATAVLALRHFPPAAKSWMKPIRASSPHGAEEAEVRLGPAEAAGISEDE